MTFDVGTSGVKRVLTDLNGTVLESGYRAYPLVTLPGRAGGYVHMGTSHQDMGPVAAKVSAPFPIEIFWADIEVAPPV